MLRVTDQYFWNFIFLVFFSILIVMGVIILETESRISLTELTMLDYALVTLASWRLIQLISRDNLTRFFREQFWDVKKIGKGFSLVKPKVGPRRCLADLLESSWSFGLWTTASVMFLYLITSYAIFPIILLAISAVATFIDDLSRLVSGRIESD